MRKIPLVGTSPATLVPFPLVVELYEKALLRFIVGIAVLFGDVVVGMLVGESLDKLIEGLLDGHQKGRGISYAQIRGIALPGGLDLGRIS